MINLDFYERRVMVDDDIMKYIPEDITFIAEPQDPQVICTRVSA